MVCVYAGRLLSLETAVLVKVASCVEKNRPPGSGCPRFCGREPVAVSAFASLVAPSALPLSASRCARSFRSDETRPWRQPAGAIPEGKVFKFRAGCATPSAVLLGSLAAHVGRPLNCRREGGSFINAVARGSSHYRELAHLARSQRRFVPGIDGACVSAC